MRWFILLCALSSACATGQKQVPGAPSFRDTWYDGNAEVSTYALSQMRYGQARDGKRIMVFVTEPLRISTRIKPDSALPDDSIVAVIKLNDTREFVTGVYNYSVMTSTFTAVEQKLFFAPGEAVKITYSGQEWCGMVLERMLRRQSAWDGNIYSYFESEGEGPYSISYEPGLTPEENLWMLVREFHGAVLDTGEEKTVPVIASAWNRRVAQTKPAAVSAVLRKEPAGQIRTKLGIIEADRFTWTMSGGQTTVLVERAWPRRILAFTEADGTQGAILASKRIPYWQMQTVGDEAVRKELRLPLPSKR